MIARTECKHGREATEYINIVHHKSSRHNPFPFLPCMVNSCTEHCHLPEFLCPIICIGLVMPSSVLPQWFSPEVISPQCVLLIFLFPISAKVREKQDSVVREPLLVGGGAEHEGQRVRSVSWVTHGL